MLGTSNQSVPERVIDILIGNKKPVPEHWERQLHAGHVFKAQQLSVLPFKNQDLNPVSTQMLASIVISNHRLDPSYQTRFSNIMFSMMVCNKNRSPKKTSKTVWKTSKTIWVQVKIQGMDQGPGPTRDPYPTIHTPIHTPLCNPIHTPRSIPPIIHDIPWFITMFLLCDPVPVPLLDGAAVVAAPWSMSLVTWWLLSSSAGASHSC